MNSGDNFEKNAGIPEIRECLHRPGVRVFYIANDPGYPPVLFVEGCAEATVVSLTNQVIRVACPYCFNAIRREATKC